MKKHTRKIVSPSGKGKHISVTEQTLTQHWSVIHRVNAICPLLSYLGFYHSPSLPRLPHPSAGFFFFCSGEFPQLFQSLHCYLGMEPQENNASCCFGCATADALPLCFNFTLLERVHPGSRQNCIVNATFFSGTNLHQDGVISQRIHCAVSIHFRMIRDSTHCQFKCYFNISAKSSQIDSCLQCWKSATPIIQWFLASASS